MRKPEKVVEMLGWQKYHKHWPHIPKEHLIASCVNLKVGNCDEFKLVLLHKRRVSLSQASGGERAHVCEDCYDAFSQHSPGMCRYAIANHLWLGRWGRLFRKANLSHQMLLALARIVTTKIVLRPGDNTTAKNANGAAWDFLFHQAGMIGTAILFGNANCEHALQHFPPSTLKDSFAVSFVRSSQARVGDPRLSTASPDEALRHEGLAPQEQDAQQEARRLVKGIARLQVTRSEFDEQARILLQTNIVYRSAEYKAGLVAKWCPRPDEPMVPDIIVEGSMISEQYFSGWGG